MTIAASGSTDLAGALAGTGGVLHPGAKILCRGLVFLALALTAGVLGFGGIGPVAAWVAKATFFISMTIFFASSIASLACTNGHGDRQLARPRR